MDNKYCELQDIEREFKNTVFNETSAVKGDTVEEWIIQESNYIDMRIGQKYATPIDKDASPLSFALLKKIVIFFVSDRVRNVLEVKTQTNLVNQEVKASTSITRRPQKDLDMILDGKIILKDALTTSTTDGIGFEESEPLTTFSVGKEQW